MGKRYLVLAVLLVSVFSIFAQLVVRPTQVNANPQFLQGQLACKDGDLRFDIAANNSTVKNSDNGTIMAAIWAKDANEYNSFVHGSGQLSSYNTAYYLYGSCIGSTSTISTIEVFLLPKLSDTHVWEGFSLAYGSSTELAAVRFTFSSDYSSYTITVFDADSSQTNFSSISSTSISDLFNTKAGNAVAGGVQYDSLVNGNYPASSLGNLTALNQAKQDLGSATDPGGPPTDPGCSPKPLCEATVEATVVDAAHITVSSVKFNNSLYTDIIDPLYYFEKKLDDDVAVSHSTNLLYSLQNTVCSGDNSIDFTDGSAKTNLYNLGPTANVIFKLSYKDKDGTCQPSQTTTITISNPAYFLPSGSSPNASIKHSAILFMLTDVNTIRRVDGESGNEYTYTLNSNALDPTAPLDSFVRTDNSTPGGCFDYIKRDGAEYRRATLVTNRKGDCTNGTSTTVYLLVTSDNKPVGDVLPSSDTIGSDTTIAKSCESETGWVGWIACPFIKGISAAIEWVDNTINSSLQADIPDTVDQNNNSTRTQMHLVWSNIRNIAYAILVPMMLVMVIGSALDIGPFNAYSVKKSLPRMVMAVMFIALSWNICLTIIDVVNSIGIGVKGIIEHPFNDGNPITLATLFGGTVSFATYVEQTLLVATAIGAAIYFLIFSFPIVMLFLIITFMTLVLRRILIIALFLAAPVAILSWVFPANNKLWKSWWSSFSKLLLIYPMIMALIATGHVFAYILNLGGDAGIFNFVFRTLAYIMPLAFIPATFKLAGGMFATITGAMNDRSRGLFDRARKGRQERFKRAGERALDKKFFKGDVSENSFRGRANARIQKLAHANRAFDQGILSARKNWRQNIGTAIQQTDAKTQKHMMDDAFFSNVFAYDDLAGMAADVISGNKYGIYRRLKKQNKDWDEATLEARTNEIMSSIHSGDRAGALTKGLTYAKAYNGDSAAINRGVAHVMRASRTYGDEPLAQALVKKAAAGGTYYQDAADAMVAQGLVTKGNETARNEMTGTIRGIHTNAGRVDIGGSSFGNAVQNTNDLMAEFDQLDAGNINLEEMERRAEGVQAKHTRHVLENNAASTMLHPSMKSNYIRENLLDFAAKELRNSSAAYFDLENGRPDLTTNESDEQFDARKAAALDKYMHDLAQVDTLYAQGAGTKDEFRSAIGNIVNGTVDIKAPEGSDSPTQKVLISDEIYRYKNTDAFRKYSREFYSKRDGARSSDDAALAIEEIGRGGAPPEPGGTPGGPAVRQI